MRASSASPGAGAPAAKPAHERGAAAKAGLQQQWWEEARRASQLQTPAKSELRPSRSAASSPLPQEVLEAVALRRSICSGNRHGPAGSPSASPDAGAGAAGGGGASFALPACRAPPGGLLGSCDAGALRQGGGASQHMRRSMAAAGAPPPTAQSAYVSDREVASSCAARSGEKAQLVSYLQGRASTVGRVMGSPPPPDPAPPQLPAAFYGGFPSGVGVGGPGPQLLLLQPPTDEVLMPPLSSCGGARSGAGGAAASGCGAGWGGGGDGGAAREPDVFLWDHLPVPGYGTVPSAASRSFRMPQAQVAGQPQRRDSTSPFAEPAQQSAWRRTASPRPPSRGGRTSLAAAAAEAVRARSPGAAPSGRASPLGGGARGLGGAGTSDARRESTAAFLEGRQSLVDQITFGMPGIEESPPPRSSGFGLEGAWGQDGGMSGGGGRQSAVGQAINARLASAGEEDSFSCAGCHMHSNADAGCQMRGLRAKKICRVTSWAATLQPGLNPCPRRRSEPGPVAQPRARRDAARRVCRRPRAAGRRGARAVGVRHGRDGAGGAAALTEPRRPGALLPSRRLAGQRPGMWL